MSLQRFDAVAWPVPPGNSPTTRPTMLIRALERRALIPEESPRYFHGRQPSRGLSSNRGAFFPTVPETGRVAVFSPVFGLPSTRESLWVDMYDDWSIAPDINRWHRARSARTYHLLRRQAESFGLITCNTPYMAGKLGLPSSAVVPNGVDPQIAAVPRTGDDKRRLVILGHLFSGRTDFSLMQQVAEAGRFDEVVIGAPGSDPKVSQFIRALGERARVFDWIDSASLGSVIGRRTVALAPQLVNDYTLSQDMMKIYQFLAHGLRVICPRLLWPSHVSHEYAYLVDFGARLEATLPEWVDGVPLSEAERNLLAHENSWDARAGSVEELLS